MRKVTVNRPQKIKLPFTKGRVILNGKECEIVKAGKSVTFEVPDGNHELQVIFNAVPVVNSNPVRIDSTDGDTRFEIKITVPINNDETHAELFKV